MMDLKRKARAQMEFFFFKKNIPSPEYSKQVPKFIFYQKYYREMNLKPELIQEKNVMLNKRIVKFDLNMLCSKVYWICFQCFGF